MQDPKDPLGAEISSLLHLLPDDAVDLLGPGRLQGATVPDCEEGPLQIFGKIHMGLSHSDRSNREPRMRLLDGSSTWTIQLNACEEHMKVAKGPLIQDPPVLGSSVSPQGAANQKLCKCLYPSKGCDAANGIRHLSSRALARGMYLQGFLCRELVRMLTIILSAGPLPVWYHQGKNHD